MNVRHWPTVVALLAIIVLGSYLAYTERLVRAVRAQAEVHQRMYATVQRGLLTLEPGAELAALLELQKALTGLGVPVVAVNADGEPYAVANLPFEADLSDAADRRRVLAYAARLDQRNAPAVESRGGAIHFGPPPIVNHLRGVAALQIAGAVLLLFVGYVIVRSTLRAERERLWSAMARELAHQMGTPLTSLKGWVEMLRLPAAERSKLTSDEHIANEVETDLERLERVSRRFELIGKPPALEEVDIREVLAELERYLRPRLPRFGPNIRFELRARRRLPPLRANRVLLVWALENLVKNSLDALAGRGGVIRVLATTGPDAVRLIVVDDGAGIDARVRDRVFEPGVTTKPGGWGVGLSLTRRIIEEVHDGRIESRGRRSGGTVFELHVPAAAAIERSTEKDERSLVPHAES